MLPIYGIFARHDLTRRMLDVSFCNSSSDELRPNAEASHILILTADACNSEIDVVAAFSEFLLQLHGAGIADSVSRRADGVAEWEH